MSEERVVYWEADPSRTRVVRRACTVCYPNPEEYGEDFLVSPQGISHQGRDHGMTVCGKDATYPGWWWRT